VFGEGFIIEGLRSTLPEVFLCTTACLLLMFGASVGAGTRDYSDHPEHGRVTSFLSARGVPYLAILALAIMAVLYLHDPRVSWSAFGGSIIMDPFIGPAKMGICITVIAVLLISIDTLRRNHLNAFEYSALTLFATLGMTLLVSSGDLITLYVALEMQSLCLYVLAAFHRGSSFSTEAGLKYFILGAFASGLLLFGCMLTYGFAGTVNFVEISRLLLGSGAALSQPFLAYWCEAVTPLASSGIVAGLLLICAGILFKLTAAPFHMWAPDVYEGAPTTVTAFFATAPKVAAMALLIRLLFTTFYELLATWHHMIGLVAILSMVVASLSALRQRRLKRLMAYSSIGHVGYLLVGVSTGTVEGIAGTMLYLAIYVMMSLNVWAILLVAEGENNEKVRYIGDLASLMRGQPILAITFALVLFSMAGVPPLAGFCAKLYVFMAAIEADRILLAVVGVLTSVIGAFYYIRIIKVIYFESRRRSATGNMNPACSSWLNINPIGLTRALILGVTLLGVITLFAYPSPLIGLTHQMALGLLV
jgi:NADH-quinone oxidoreductase subunit N